MSDRMYSVLFLSRRDSARSVIAAALLNQIGRGVFRAFSAGVQPASAYDPIALEVLEHAHAPSPEGTPKHYRTFAVAGAPALDFVFTLSDTAAGEPLPAWPGLPVTGHWSSSDPERAKDDEVARRRSLIATRAQLERRLRVFVNLRLESLDRLSLQAQVDEICDAQNKSAAGGIVEPPSKVRPIRVSISDHNAR
jgi:arsenate reductase